MNFQMVWEKKGREEVGKKMNGEVKPLENGESPADLKEGGGRNVSSSSGMLSTFERFVTVERITEAVKWGCVNMPAVEEHRVGLPANFTASTKIKRLNEYKRDVSEELIGTSLNLQMIQNHTLFIN